MSNKKILGITFIIIILVLIFFAFYLLFIKPVIIGEYKPSIKECTKAYDCDCLGDSCICFYKKYFWENRLTCPKNILDKSKINNP